MCQPWSLALIEIFHAAITTVSQRPTNATQHTCTSWYCIQAWCKYLWYSQTGVLSMQVIYRTCSASCSKTSIWIFAVQVSNSKAAAASCCCAKLPGTEYGTFEYPKSQIFKRGLGLPSNRVFSSLMSLFATPCKHSLSTCG